MKHVTMIKKALLPRQLCAFWIFPRSHFEKYENKMQTKKVQTGFVSFTTACLLSCNSIIVTDQFCLWYCHWGYALHTNSKLSWARICYGRECLQSSASFYNFLAATFYFGKSLRSGPPVAVALYVASCGHDTWWWETTPPPDTWQPVHFRSL